MAESSDTFLRTLLSPVDSSLRLGVPVQSGQTTLLPLHATVTSFGGGFGQPPTNHSSSSSGGGGGGMIFSRPVVVAEISPRGVRLHPVIDLQRLLLWSLLLISGLAFGVLFIAFLRRLFRRHKASR